LYPYPICQKIGICIEKVKKVFKDYNIDGEIIVADNLTDRTPEIAKSLGAKVVTPDKKGYGYAYLYGFRFAKGRYIVIGDADNTYVNGAGISNVNVTLMRLQPEIISY